MNKLNQQNEALIISIDKGYFVDRSGNLYNKKREKLSGRNCNGYLCKSIRIGERKKGR